MRRPARPDDLVALRDLERVASQASLGHIFAPHTHPYPDDRVLARWRLLLEDAAVSVRVDERDGRLCGLAAYDDRWLRHLAVDPGHWGTGLAADLVEESLADMAGRGTRTARLWVLADNHRARAFYERSGWVRGGAERPAEFAPHPAEVDYHRVLGPPGARRG